MQSRGNSGAHTGQTMPRWHWPAVGLFAIVGALYWPAMGFEFVNWDDPWYVIENASNKSWNPSNLKAIFTEVANRNYAPVTMFVLLVEHTLFGLNPAGYHAVNVVLHAVNAVLVYALLRQVTGSAMVGLWSAILFAVHPVQVESVAWVSSLKGLLCSAFLLAYLICWLRPERTAKQEGWGLVFFGVALLAKALTIVAPLVVLLYDVWILRKKWSESLARQFIPGMLSVWVLLTTMRAQEAVLGGMRGHFELSKPHILAVDSIILWQYVRMLLWPTDLCVLYDPPTHGIILQATVASLCWGLVLSAAWVLRRSAPLLTFGIVSWLILLLPVLNLTPITTLMNDRYLYLPCVPFFALCVSGLRRMGITTQNGASDALPSIRIRHFVRGFAWRVLPTAAATLFAILTVQHLPVWRNDEALWQHAITHLPRVPVVRIQYAWMLHHRGQTDAAIAILRETLRRYEPDTLDRERIERTIADWNSTLSERHVHDPVLSTIPHGV